MGRSLLKVFLPLLLLFQLYNCQWAPDDEPNHQNEAIGSSFADLIRHISKQDVRIFELESRDKQQEQEVSGLKATVDDNKKEIHFLKNRVALLEASTENIIIPDEQHKLMKRPVRLLPVSILYGKKNKTYSEVSMNIENRFYGPPTNCSELAKLGYTLNGFYLIKNGSEQGSIGIVYCQFYKQEKTPEKQNLETFIENVRLYKTKSTVLFHVQRAKNVSAPRYLLFDQEIFNIGKAFHMGIGVFYAPVAGLYHFSFNGLKDNSAGHLAVYFDFNMRLKEIMTRTDGSLTYIPISLSAYFRMKPGDAIRIMLQGNGKLFEENYLYWNTQFSGYLVEED